MTSKIIFIGVVLCLLLSSCSVSTENYFSLDDCKYIIYYDGDFIIEVIECPNNKTFIDINKQEKVNVK